MPNQSIKNPRSIYIDSHAHWLMILMIRLVHNTFCWKKYTDITAEWPTLARRRLLINLFCYNVTINTRVEWIQELSQPPGTFYVYFEILWCDEYAIFGEGMLKAHTPRTFAKLAVNQVVSTLEVCLQNFAPIALATNMKRELPNIVSSSQYRHQMWKIEES